MRSIDVLGKEVRVEGRLVRVAFLDGEGYQFLGDPDAAISNLRRRRSEADLFTFIQKLSETTPKFGFPMERDNMAALHVSTYDHWMKNQIDFKVRNKIRKAEKAGVEVREVPFDDNLLNGIRAIYNESPFRQGKPFWHYGKDIGTLRKMKATFLDRSVFIGAFFENKLIGFIKLVANDDSSQAGLMHIISMFQYRDKAPTNALIARAVRSCGERKIPYLWYANFSYGNKQEDSLAEFKRHNGFQKIEIPRYYVPLTIRGRMALRLGLHHRIIDWVPEPMTAMFRRVRGYWYARKLTGRVA